MNAVATEQLVMPERYWEHLTIPRGNGQPHQHPAMEYLAPREYPSVVPGPATLLRAHHTLALATQHALPVQFLGYREPFQEPIIFRTRSRDWVITPLRADPLFRHYGNRLYAPDWVVRRVQAMVRAGLDFDDIYIAHELPDGSDLTRDDLLDLIKPPPPASKRWRLEMLDMLVIAWWHVVRGAIGTTISLSTFAGRVLLSSALLALNASGALLDDASRRALAAEQRRPVLEADIGNLDPILFGVLLDAESSTAMWFYIAHWHWGEEE